MSSSEAGEGDKGLALSLSLWTVAEGARKVRGLFGIVGRVRAFGRGGVLRTLLAMCEWSWSLAVAMSGE